MRWSCASCATPTGARSTSSCFVTAAPSSASNARAETASAAPACRYFRERTDIPRFYQVHLGTADFGDADTDTRVLPLWTFCAEMALP